MTFKKTKTIILKIEMRAFIVLALIAFARADVGGYNYEANNAVGGGFSSGGYSGTSGGSSVGSSGGSYYEAPAELEKEFYSFSAPEHEFEDSQPVQDVASSLKRNLQVIFIKGPENNGLANAAVNLARSATDSRTAIYVLQKQTGVGDLAQKLESTHTHNAHKPEVHFVKYRTPEDAQHAQNAIQSQYDQLGGSSQSHHGGVAPVLNFASQPAAYHGGGGVGAGVAGVGAAGAGVGVGGAGGVAVGVGGAAPSSGYIPPQAPSTSYLPNLRL